MESLKNYSASVAHIAFYLEIGCKIAIWFQDEAGVEQKTTQRRRWAKRGWRPAPPVDQGRVQSEYLEPSGRYKAMELLSLCYAVRF